MARPGRKRKLNVERYPSGEVKPVEILSPILSKRLMMASAARMADEQWGSVIGRYFLTGQISSAQYEAARKFGALSETYDKIMQGPKPPAQCIGERIISAQVDPFSEAGEAEVERHKQVNDNFERLRAVVGSRSLFDEMRRMCAGAGELPFNYERFLLIRAALGTLVIFWKIDSK
jgi:hypothetical protein